MFLFAGEFAERFSFYGMRAILPLYLSDQLGFGEAQGALYYTIFLGACYFLPLVGGFIADNFLGKYWTIVGFSLPYVVGQFLVGFDSPLILVVALGLLAMGTGVIKPNISTLMGLTYDQKRPGQDKLRSNAFQYFYMSINIGEFLSQTIVPIVRTETGGLIALHATGSVHGARHRLVRRGEKVLRGRGHQSASASTPRGRESRSTKGTGAIGSAVPVGDILLGGVRSVFLHLGLLRPDIHGSSSSRVRTGA